MSYRVLQAQKMAARVSLCRNNLLNHRFSSAPSSTADGISRGLLANCKLARSGNNPHFDSLPPHCLLRPYKHGGSSQFPPVGGLRKNRSFCSDTDDDSSSDHYSDSDQDMPNTWGFKQDDNALNSRMDTPGVGKEDVKVVGSSHMLKEKGIRKLDPKFGDDSENGSKPFVHEIGKMSGSKSLLITYMLSALRGCSFYALESLLRMMLQRIKGATSGLVLAMLSFPAMPAKASMILDDFTDCHRLYYSCSYILRECYTRMRVIGGVDDCDGMSLISIRDFVELFLRCPSSHRPRLWEEIVSSRVVVQDDMLSVYPMWWTKHVLPYLRRRELVHPVQIIIPRRPRDGWVKIYVDASPNHYWHFAGGGIVLIDSRGHITCTWTQEPADSVFEAECAVLAAGVRYALREGISRVTFVCDSLDVVEVVSGHSYIQIGDRFERVYCSLMSELLKLDDWTIEHIPREGNELADLIARFASGMPATYNYESSIVLFNLEPYPSRDYTSDMVRACEKLRHEIPSIRWEDLSRVRSTRYSPRISPKNNSTSV